VAHEESGEGEPAAHRRIAAAWALAAAALAVGLAPMGAVHLVFGGAV